MYYGRHMKFFGTLCMKTNSIFGAFILDFFFVTKFQKHGSQHDHGLLWVTNAPLYGLDSNNAIENFVKKYISCGNNKLTPNLHEAQTHRYKKTCRKKNQAICQLIFHGLWKKHKFLNHSQWNF
jgi:hypothetical protein